MHKAKKRNLLCFLPIIFGVILGSAVMYFFGKHVPGAANFWGEGMLEEVQVLQYKHSTYMMYLIKVRGMQVGFVVAMSLIHKKELATFIWGFLTGVGFGFGVYDLCMQCGMKGIVGYLFMIFPHYICYLWAYEKVFGIDLNSQKIKVFGVVIIGILLECYVNPMFLKIFSKIFF